MNKIIDALKLAENTLRDIIRVYKFETGTPVTALAAIREALADHSGGANEMVAEPVKQEPVAVVEYSDFQTAGAYLGEELKKKAVRELYEGALQIGQHLYAASVNQNHIPDATTIDPVKDRSEESFMAIGVDEALRLAEEAFDYYKNDCSGAEPSLSVFARKVDNALAAIRAARAQEQAEQEPLMDYERINALREGEQNGAEDAYFFVRPENDTPTLRKMFCQGFERGFHKGLKYAAPVQQVDLTDDEIMDLVRDECVDMRWPSTPLFIARAVIANLREKEKHK